MRLLLAHGANPKASDNDEGLSPLELIEQTDARAGQRARDAGDAAGLGAWLFGANQRAEYRERAAPIAEMLKEARHDWSLLDTLRYKLTP